MLLRSRLILLKPQPSISAVRFRSGSAEPSSEKMETGHEQQKPPSTQGTTMADSLGHEYATRSEEEGFGVVHDSNQSLKKNGEEEGNPYAAGQGGSHGREREEGEGAGNDRDKTDD